MNECQHLRGLFNHQDIEKYLYIFNYGEDFKDFDSKIAVRKEIALVFQHKLSDMETIQSDEIIRGLPLLRSFMKPCFIEKLKQSQVLSRDLFDSLDIPYIKDILSLDSTAHNRKIFAGMTRLHTAFTTTKTLQDFDWKEVTRSIWSHDPINQNTFNKINQLIYECTLTYKDQELQPLVFTPLIWDPGVKSSPYPEFIHDDNFELSGYRLRSVKRSDPRCWTFEIFKNDPEVRELHNEFPAEFGIGLFGRPITLPEPSMLIPKELISKGPKIICNPVIEPGGKLRIAMSPLLAYQGLVLPLHTKVYNFIKRIKSQGVTSHENALKDIQHEIALNEAKGFRPLIFSGDLSNYSDNIPTDSMNAIMEGLITRNIISEFDYKSFNLISNLPIQLPDYSVIKYDNGNPQGAFGSFPLISLFNDVLVRVSFCMAYGVSPTDINENVNSNMLPFYKVVGDDVVIFDQKTSEQYVSIVEDLGMQISKLKCMKSYTTAEFCSRFVDSQGIYRKKKINVEDSYSSLYDAIAYYGIKPISEMTGITDRFLSKYTLPPPFGMGIGTRRIRKLIPIIQELDKYLQQYLPIQPNHMTYNEIVKRLVSLGNFTYNDNYSNDSFVSSLDLNPNEVMNIEGGYNYELNPLIRANLLLLRELMGIPFDNNNDELFLSTFKFVKGLISYDQTLIDFRNFPSIKRSERNNPRAIRLYEENPPLQISTDLISDDIPVPKILSYFGDYYEDETKNFEITKNSSSKPKPF